MIFFIFFLNNYSNIMNNYENISSDLLKSFYKRHDSAFIQINSFNHFIEHLIPRIFNENPHIVIEFSEDISYVVRFGQSYVDPPSIITDDRSIKYLFPNEARLRELTYESSVYIDIGIYTYTNDKLTNIENFLKVEVIKIPMMLKSYKCNLYNHKELNNECISDDGGYFIIKGKERVIVTQERMAYDNIFVFRDRKEPLKYSFTSEIRSISEETGHSVCVKCSIKKNGRGIYFLLPYIKEPIPIGLLLSAYETSITECISMMGPLTERMVKSLEYADFEYKRLKHDDILDNIYEYVNFNSKYNEFKTDIIKQILTVEIFPHIPIYSKKEYTFLLAQMIRKVLLCHFTPNDRKPDDKDHLSLKRYDAVGILMFDVIRALWKKTLTDVFVTNRKPNIKLLGPKVVTISKYLHKCFAKGVWGLPNNSHQRVGVCQLLTRINHLSAVSHLRRTVIAAVRNSKKSQIRQISQSQFGFVCSVSTPEGANTGLVKNIACMAYITNHVSYLFILPIIRSFKTFYPDQGIPILVNGHFIGFTDDVQKFKDEFYECYMLSVIDCVSLCFDPIDYIINIFSDAGRLIRPLLTVDVQSQKVKLFEEMPDITDWNLLVRDGYVKFVDSYETEFSIIAMYGYELVYGKTLYNYVEIHPAYSLSYEALTIPFSDHSQSPRNIYESAMCKQAIGWPLNNIHSRFDKALYFMNYLQKQLVESKPSKILEIEEMPSGLNAIVAILPFTGFNQEDSVIFNQSAIDRGLYRATSNRTIEDEEHRFDTNNYEKIEFPSDDVVSKKSQYNYDHLGPDGLISIGTRVFENDVVIGKVVYRLSDNNIIIEDCSKIVKRNEEGVVDNVCVTTNLQGQMIVKIKIRHEYIPEIGDKFASTCAQKGVLGMTYRQEDLPFTAEGIVPDIIINSLALPSRMTVNQVISTILGKDTLINGTEYDSSPFTNFSGTIADVLKSKKFEQMGHGKEVMYNGFTGEPFKAKIFIGPTYYHRLKHLVHDKIHARESGDIQLLTRQPLEGRSRSGGLRIGEMENDAFKAQGASNLLLERTFSTSDEFKIYVCAVCGMMANSPTFCEKCNNDDVRYCYCPYASKLLFQYMTACGIKLKFTTELS
jgi:DNA-directed RNA polymerase II subunit RPB2